MIQAILLYLCALNTLNMAIPIKAVPILSGEAADEFVRRAEAKERGERTPLTLEQKEKVDMMMRQLREFKPSWRQ